MRLTATTTLASVILAISLLASPTYGAITDSCKGTLPQKLEQVIKRDYPGWEVVTLRHLPDWRQLEYENNREKSCPGVAKVNFYGDRRLAYALVLIKQLANEEDEENLLLAYLDKAGQWRLVMLWDAACPCKPDIEPAGEYQDFYRKKTIRSKGEVIVLDHGSAARLFAWTGDKIEYIHFKD